MSTNGSSMVDSASKVEADDRKIFVGGLHWEATVDDLRAYMENWGPVKDATIKMDPMGKPRGFGFVLFENADSVEAVLNAGPLSLKEKKIEAKRAAIKEIKQIFVGGVNPQMPEEDIRMHFEQYGEIESIDLPKDATKGTRRGFVFITYVTAEGCNAACEPKGKQQLGENMVDVKKAVPQQKDYYAGGGGGGGGYGGAYDPYGYGYGYGYPPAAPYAPRGGRGAPRGGRGGAPGMVGYPSYNPYDQSSWYGYPPAPAAGGGKMRGRGRGAPRGGFGQ